MVYKILKTAQLLSVELLKQHETTNRVPKKEWVGTYTADASKCKWFVFKISLEFHSNMIEKLLLKSCWYMKNMFKNYMFSTVY